MAEHRTPADGLVESGGAQSNGWVWLPDMLGCVCFLASGRLALRDVDERRWGVRVHRLDWWVAAVNQVDSIDNPVRTRREVRSP